MKNIYKLLLIAFAVLAGVSCKGSLDPQEPAAKAAEVIGSYLKIPAKGGESFIYIKSAETVKADALKDWVSISTSRSNDTTTVVASALANESFESRYSQVLVKAGDQTFEFTVQQLGFQTSDFDPRDININSDAASFDLPYTYDEEMIADVDVDWITLTVTKDNLHIEIAENTTDATKDNTERVGIIAWSLGHDGGLITVTQKNASFMKQDSNWTVTYDGRHNDDDGELADFITNTVAKAGVSGKYMLLYAPKDQVDEYGKMEDVVLDVLAPQLKEELDYIIMIYEVLFGETLTYDDFLSEDTYTDIFNPIEDGKYYAFAVGLDSEDCMATGHYNYCEFEVKGGDDPTPPATGYSAWLGEWEVKRGSTTDTWKIEKKVEGSTYTVTGIEGQSFPVEAEYDAATSSFVLHVQENIATVNSSYGTASVGVYGQFVYEADGEEYFVTGDYDIFTASMTSSTAAKMTPGKVNLSGIGEVTLSSFLFLGELLDGEYAGEYLSFSQDATALPNTMTKKGGDPTPPSSGYSAWLGEWDVKRGSSTDTWKIEKKSEGSTYTVTGIEGQSFPVEAKYDAATSSFVLHVQENIATKSTSYGTASVGVYGQFVYEADGEEYFVTGDYDIFTASMTSSTAAKMTPGKVNLSGIGEVTLSSFLFLGELLDGEYVGEYLSFSQDATALPNTMTKKGSGGGGDEGGLKFYGTAIWHDVFVDSWFGLAEDGYNVDMDCDVYTDSSKPGVYYFDSPYWYDNIAGWFDSTPEEMKQYTGNYQEAMIAIDCSDPNAVSMARQPLGVSLSSTYGWFSGGSIGADGKFENNTITFVGDKLVKAMELYNNGGWYYVSNPSAAEEDKLIFTVKITPGGSPVKPASASAKAVRTTSAKKIVDARKNAKCNAIEKQDVIKAKAFAAVVPTATLQTKSVKALDLPATKSNIKVVLRKIKK